MAFSLVGWLGIGAYLGHLQAAEGLAPPERAPHLELEPRVVDLGEVLAHTRTPFTVEVRNRGRAPLKIFDVGVSCGCLHVGLEDNSTVAPGSSLRLKAYFDSSAYFGEMTKELTVRSNDPERPEAPIVVRTRITPLLEGPPLLILPGLKPGATVTAGLDLRPGRPELPLELGRVTTDVPELKLLELTRISGGFHLGVEVTTSRAVEGTLKVEVRQPRQVTVDVPVRLEMQP